MGREVGRGQMEGDAPKDGGQEIACGLTLGLHRIKDNEPLSSSSTFHWHSDQRRLRSAEDPGVFTHYISSPSGAGVEDERWPKPSPTESPARERWARANGSASVPDVFAAVMM